MPAKKKTDEIKFEDALQSLEKIVSDMESGDLPLEDVLQKYEKGIELADFCTEKLSEAEERIEILAKKKETRPRKVGQEPELTEPENDLSENEDQNSLF